MPEQDVHVDQTKNIYALILTATQKRFQAFAQAQSELTKMTAEINRYWADRGHSEANMASEFASKLVAAHSASDAVTAWQEYGKHRLERMAENGKHLAADIQQGGCRFSAQE
ncbi:phasin family protein [Bradyrhizobium sp.]|uniref:phasin family protein n=1 Tax=Bradyrhizobium sp. TaxID=376 RepID=UPI003C56CED9